MSRPPERADALVRVTEVTAEDLAALVRAARPALRPWMPWATSEYTVDSAAGFLAMAETSWADGAAFHYAIAPDGDPIGVCGLDTTIGPRGLEIGYWLHPAHTGRGHATRATRTLIALAATVEDVDHVEIHHDRANHPSRAIPHRLGFTLVDAEETRPIVAPGETGVGMVWRLALPVTPD
ncbi:GNAT family N-acetyltransferase [Actinokineospora guangxiensis]|uniref:GNAT family N-acetyltransferase n=1 Tax=Actinokineospora guangxiensis TaxID=1490288 RepID=A0ABW0EHI4_9PSEU